LLRGPIVSHARQLILQMDESRLDGGLEPAQGFSFADRRAALKRHAD
jgi:hypothetical protein